MSKEYVKWIIIAVVIASPVAFVMMDKWLQYFVYHGGMQFWIFAVTIIFCLFLTMFLIVFQILRLNRLNPIDFIRYE